MATEDEKVKFGGDTKEFDESTRRVLAGLNSIKDSVKGMSGLLGEMAAAFGVAFSLDKIFSFIESMGSLGEQTLNTAEKFGIATEEVGFLDFAAKSVGSSGEALTRALTRMSTSLVDVSGKATPTSAAIKALGLDAKELAELPLPDILDKLREKFSALPAGLERTAIAQNLVRNGAETILPLLKATEQEWAQLKVAFSGTGAAMSQELAEAFDATDDKIDVMKTALQGLGQRIFTVLQPAINVAIDAITQFVESLDAETVKSALEQVLTTMVSVMSKITEVALEAWRIIQNVLIHTQYLLEFGVAAGTTRVVEAMGRDLDKMNADTDAKLTASKAMFESWAATIKGALAAGKNSSGSPDDRDTLMPKLGSSGKRGKAPSLLDLGGGGSGSDALSAAQAAVNGELAVLAAGLERKKAVLDADLASKKINDQQYAEAYKAMLDEQYAAEVALYQKELGLGGLKLAQRQEILNRLKLLEVQHANEIAAIQQKAAEATRRAWMQPINAIGEAFAGQVSGLVNGTETLGEAVLNIGSQIASDLISQAIRSITALAAQAFAGVFAHDAPSLGLGAAATAGAASSAVMAGAAALGGAVASADVGTWGLPADAPIQAHKGEVILPRFESEQFRNLAGAVTDMVNGGGRGGGGPIVNFNGPVFDARKLASVVRDMFNGNPGLRPSY